MTAPTTSYSPARPDARPRPIVEDGETRSLTAIVSTATVLTVTLDGLRTDYLVAADGRADLAGRADGGTAMVEEVREAPVRPDDEHSGDAELDQPHAGFGRRRRRRTTAQR